MFDLTGKNALVTGASGGIGAEIARALHKQGAVVALSGTRREALDALAAELGERVHVLAADLSLPEAAAELIANAEAALGSVDILVNNAGLTKDGLALRMSDADWAKVMDVDLAAPFRLSRAALKFMLRRKAGLIGLTKALAQEVASRGITVNLIAPGFISTPMTDVLSEANRAALSEKIPLGRLGSPGDIAAGVVYLAAEEAGWITGATLHINGGMAML